MNLHYFLFRLGRLRLKTKVFSIISPMLVALSLVSLFLVSNYPQIKRAQELIRQTPLGQIAYAQGQGFTPKVLRLAVKKEGQVALLNNSNRAISIVISTPLHASSLASLLGALPAHNARVKILSLSVPGVYTLSNANNPQETAAIVVYDATLQKTPTGLALNTYCLSHPFTLACYLEQKAPAFVGNYRLPGANSPCPEGSNIECSNAPATPPTVNSDRSHGYQTGPNSACPAGSGLYCHDATPGGPTSDCGTATGCSFNSGSNVIFCVNGNCTSCSPSGSCTSITVPGVQPHPGLPGPGGTASPATGGTPGVGSQRISRNAIPCSLQGNIKSSCEQDGYRYECQVFFGGPEGTSCTKSPIGTAPSAGGPDTPPNIPHNTHYYKTPPTGCNPTSYGCSGVIPYGNGQVIYVDCINSSGGGLDCALSTKPFGAGSSSTTPGSTENALRRLDTLCKDITDVCVCPLNSQGCLVGDKECFSADECKRLAGQTGGTGGTGALCTAQSGSNVETCTENPCGTKPSCTIGSRTYKCDGSGTNWTCTTSQTSGAAPGGSTAPGTGGAPPGGGPYTGGGRLGGGTSFTCNNNRICEGEETPESCPTDCGSGGGTICSWSPTQPRPECSAPPSPPGPGGGGGPAPGGPGGGFGPVGGYQRCEVRPDGTISCM